MTGYVSGFCSNVNPDHHAHCRGGVIQDHGAAQTLSCACPCHTDRRQSFLDELFEKSAWRTVDKSTGEVRFWRTKEQAQGYALENEAHKENARRKETPLDDEERALLAADAASTPVSAEVSA